MPRFRFTRPFRHADDGMHATAYEAGQTYDVSDRCAEVALQEMRGQIAGDEAASEAPQAAEAPAADDPAAEAPDAAAEPPAAQDRAGIEIPENWEDLPWPERRALAASLTDEPVKTATDANHAIKAEIERRGG